VVASNYDNIESKHFTVFIDKHSKMAKAITKEELMGIRKRAEEQWIRSKVRHYEEDVRKNAAGDLFEVQTNGLTWNECIPAKYKHLEQALYCECKERFPDSTIVVAIVQERWFFCFKYYRLTTTIRW